MLSNGLGRNRLLRASALASAVLLVGCGGGDKKNVSAGAQATSTAVTTPATTVLTTTSALSTTSSPPTTGSRSPVSTTTTAQPADSMVTRELLVESTLSETPELRPLVMNGVSYVNALRMYSIRTPSKVEINAGRNRKTFMGVLGIPDEQKSSSSHQVEISLDNAAPAYSVVVNFGESKMINLDVTNVLRIRITVSSKTAESGSVAIGNPRFG